MTWLLKKTVTIHHVDPEITKYHEITVTAVSARLILFNVMCDKMNTIKEFHEAMGKLGDVYSSKMTETKMKQIYF